MAAAGVPTAAYKSFSEAEAACEYIASRGAPIVVKTDGLAAGKGVIVAATVEEAQAAARGMLEEGTFGDSGQRIVVEDLKNGRITGGISSWRRVAFTTAEVGDKSKLSP